MLTLLSPVHLRERISVAPLLKVDDLFLTAHRWPQPLPSMGQEGALNLMALILISQLIRSTVMCEGIEHRI